MLDGTVTPTAIATTATLALFFDVVAELEVFVALC